MELDSRNIYKTGRSVAGMTQERWAEAIGVSVDSVRGYEAGTQIPGDDVVQAMCEIRGLTALGYWHISNKSKVAAELLPAVDVVPMPQAVCALLSEIRRFTKFHEPLLDIAADGRLAPSEYGSWEKIAEALDDIVRAALTLKYSDKEG